MEFQGDYSGGGGGATTRANQSRETAYTYGLFESADPKIETSLQALAELVRTLMTVDESELLAQISERGIQGLARLRLSDQLPVPDLGDWDALEPAPTRRLTDEEYAAYATAKR